MAQDTETPKHPNELQPSHQARHHLERALTLFADEGFDVVGFIFKAINYQQETEAYILETFSSKPAPLPILIAQMEASIVMMREQIPENFNLESEQQKVAHALEGKLQTALDKLN